MMDYEYFETEVSFERSESLSLLEKARKVYNILSGTEDDYDFMDEIKRNKQSLVRVLSTPFTAINSSQKTFLSTSRNFLDLCGVAHFTSPEFMFNLEKNGKFTKGTLLGCFVRIYFLSFCFKVLSPNHWDEQMHHKRALTHQKSHPQWKRMLEPPKQQGWERYERRCLCLANR